MTRNTSTVLIVDDDADIRELIKLILEKYDYRVRVAADGSEALAQLHAGAKPALIILDLMTPRIDGEQFVKQLRASSFATIPVVVMSGHHAAQKKADELGAVSCLTKPVEFDELLKTVRRFTPTRLKRDAA